MSLYDRVASTEQGRKGLASARLRRQVLKALHGALATSGMNKTDVARKLDIRKSAVGHVFGGDGNLRVNTLAEYLDAMGAEVRLEVLPAGTMRNQRPSLAPASFDSYWHDTNRSFELRVTMVEAAAMSVRTDFAFAA